MELQSKQDRMPYNPYPLGVWNVKGLSPTAKAVLGCLGAHSNYLGETLLGIERKDADGEPIGGLVWKTGWKPTEVKDAIKEISLAGRISREGRRGSKWGRNSSRTKIWLTAEELTKAGAEDLSPYPVKTPEEIAVIAEANKAAAKVRSEKKRVAMRRALRRGQGGALQGDAAAMPQQCHGYARSTAAERLTSSSQQPSGDQLMSRLATTQQPPHGHEPAVILPSWRDLQEHSEPPGSPKTENVSLCPPRKEGKTNPPPCRAEDTMGPAAAVRPSLRVALKEEVAAKLRFFGCPPKVLEMLEAHTKIAAILNGDTPNGCSNPVSAYATIAARPANAKFAKLWMPKAGGTLTGEDADFLEASLFHRQKLEQMSPEQLEHEDAESWWVGLAKERKQAYFKDGDTPWIRQKHDEGDSIDCLALWKRDRETCTSWYAKQWRKTRGLAAVGA